MSPRYRSHTTLSQERCSWRLWRWPTAFLAGSFYHQGFGGTGYLVVQSSSTILGNRPPRPAEEFQFPACNKPSSIAHFKALLRNGGPAAAVAQACAFSVYGGLSTTHGACSAQWQLCQANRCGVCAWSSPCRKVPACGRARTSSTANSDLRCADRRLIAESLRCSGSCGIWRAGLAGPSGSAAGAACSCAASWSFCKTLNWGLPCFRPKDILLTKR